MSGGLGQDHGPPFFLSPQEHKLVEALVETMIPPGENLVHEPGGREVGAPNYFDSRMLDLPEPARQAFRLALKLVDDRSSESYAKTFAVLSMDERSEILRSLLTDPTTMSLVFALRAICLEGFYSDYHDPSYLGRTAWDVLEFKGKRIDGVKKDWSFLRIYRASDGGG